MKPPVKTLYKVNFFFNRFFKGAFTSSEFLSVGTLALFAGVSFAYAYFETGILAGLVLNNPFMNFCDVLVGGYLTIVALAVPIGVNMTDKIMSNYNSVDIKQKYVMPKIRSLYRELIAWLIILIIVKIASVYLNSLLYFLVAICASLRGVYVSVTFSKRLITIVEDTETAILNDYLNSNHDECSKF